jgi:hypothetical protein
VPAGRVGGCSNASARYCHRTVRLDDLWRAWCRASEAERARFLAEVEDVPH